VCDNTYLLHTASNEVWRQRLIDLRKVEGEVLRGGVNGVQVIAPDPDIGRRAILAFLKSSKTADIPKTTVIDHVGKKYVALIASAGIPAIYRIRNDLQLKRMRRMPQPVAYAAELERRTLYV
jgi:hypothetical protein